MKLKAPQLNWIPFFRLQSWVQIQSWPHFCALLLVLYTDCDVKTQCKVLLAGRQIPPPHIGPLTQGGGRQCFTRCPDYLELLLMYNQRDVIDGIIRREERHQNVRKAEMEMGSVESKLSRDDDLSWHFPEQSSAICLKTTRVVAEQCSADGTANSQPHYNL